MMRTRPPHRPRPDLNEAAKIAVLQLEELVRIRMVLGKILRAVSRVPPVHVRVPTSATIVVDGEEIEA